ncbi:MAG: lysoplasmalogenase [Anaerolineae bacterium]|nr:lysoplasmalogenase [Anaerolineae bacterium]
MDTISIILLGLWAALLFGGFILGKLDSQRVHRMPTAARIGSSLALVALAWWFYLNQTAPAYSTYSLLIAIGMTLGLVGDLFMAGLIRVENHVIGGIAAFGLGHVAYIAALIWIGDQLGYNEFAPRVGAWAAWLAVGVVGWYGVVYSRAPVRSPIHLAALPYALLLASTAGFATGLAVQQIAFAPLALGTALFLLSDLILAAQLFAGLHFTSIGDMIWLTYGPAQMLIVTSVAALSRIV